MFGLDNQAWTPWRHHQLAHAEATCEPRMAALLPSRLPVMRSQASSDFILSGHSSSMSVPQAWWVIAPSGIASQSRASGWRQTEQVFGMSMAASRRGAILDPSFRARQRRVRRRSAVGREIASPGVASKDVVPVAAIEPIVPELTEKRVVPVLAVQ